MAVICHYALHKLHKYPSEILNLSSKERAFIIASIKQKIEDENKETKRIKSKTSSRPRRR